jgi:hypothetical protein
VDIDYFSHVAPEVQKGIISAVVAETPAAAIDTTVPKSVHPQDEASPEFTKELELTIHRGEDPVQDAPLLEICEDLPEGQAPSPSLAAFNKSFGRRRSFGTNASLVRQDSSRFWKGALHFLKEDSYDFGKALYEFGKEACH